MTMRTGSYITDNLPIEDLPEYLQGLELPATTDDALAHAAEHGAPSEVLEFIEHLPAAVFTSEEGLRHAFSLLGSVDLGELATLDEEESEAEDGISS
jgi:hypothetical protein